MNPKTSGSRHEFGRARHSVRAVVARTATMKPITSSNITSQPGLFPFQEKSASVRAGHRPFFRLSPTRFFPRKCVDSPRPANFNGQVRDAEYFPTETDLAADGAAQEMLHGRAAEATRSRFGREVFVRAVVEVSNFCRENCAYCGMRQIGRAHV